MSRVVIVGAGISGLACAYRLRQIRPSTDIVILEARDRPGGTIWTERLDGYLVEYGPNGFLSNKQSTLDLACKLGLAASLVKADAEASRRRYLLHDGKLQPLPASATEFLRTPLLSLRGKARFLCERFRPRRTDSADESVGDFARRRAGPEAATLFADALVTGIYAGDPEQLSVQAAFPRLVARETEYGSLLKGFAAAARQRRRDARATGDTEPARAMLWSFRDGMRTLIDSLARHLGPTILTGVQTGALERTAAGKPAWQVRAEGSAAWSADSVILACPAYVQATLVSALDRELAQEIAAIPYNRVAVIALGYRLDQLGRPLDGFGYLTTTAGRQDVLGVQWCSAIFPDRAPQGHALLRAMSGGSQNREIVDWDDERLLTAVRSELARTMGITTAPVFHSIVRWNRAIPQYHLGHLARLARIESRAALLPGLFLCGNAYRGVALNDCVETAGEMAKRVAAFLETSEAVSADTRHKGPRAEDGGKGE
jgi:oxygen-dependent protoporphyrinogen oxidase